MLREKKLGHWVNKIRNHLALPLRLDLWNGQQFAFSSGHPKVIIRVMDVSELNYLLKPSLFNRGETYVNGKFDVEDNTSELINIGHALATCFFKHQRNFRYITRLFHHSKKKDAAAIQYQIVRNIIG